MCDSLVFALFNLPLVVFEAPFPTAEISTTIQPFSTNQDCFYTYMSSSFCWFAYLVQQFPLELSSSTETQVPSSHNAATAPPLLEHRTHNI